MKRFVVLCAIFLQLMPLTTLAQVDFCEGNFDYDQDVDGTDASVFKSDYGRSKLSNPCPDDGPAPVAKTGQTVVYGSRDDGYWQQALGVPWPNPRFTNNGDGTVTDNLTGLVWLRNANCIGARDWDFALGKCFDLEDGNCGLTDGSSQGDWRLPNIKELQSLIDFGNTIPALPTGHPFINVQSDWYWSSTTSTLNITLAWYIGTAQGLLSTDFKGIDHYIWPVRRGQ